MIFAEGAQGASERAAIVGQVLRDGEYQIQRLLERGQEGRGWLFLAIHTTLMIPVALKQVPADKPVAESILVQLDTMLQAEDIPELATPRNSQELIFPPSDGSAVHLFAREALLLARLRYTTIPTLYDYFFEDGYWYLVMDYISGHTLTTYLQQHSPLSTLEALNCALQICDTLDYLHTQSPAIVLRNLTTESIRVTLEGILILTNFDLATYSQSQTIDDETEEEATRPEHVHHPGDTETEMLAYTSEEPPPGARQNKDISSDIYSLGVILREMVYGQSMEHDNSSIASEDHHPLPISTYLKSLVRLATRSEPLDRFQSAQTFSLALQRAYQIEEQRTFQEHLSQLNEQKSDIERRAEEAMRGDKSSPAGSQEGTQRERKKEEGAPHATPFRSLELRDFTRTAMQKIRRERLDQEQVELQLASVDEGLEQRSSMSHSQISLQAIAQAEAPIAVIPSLQRFQRLIKINFVLALLLCLVLVSLLIYIRVAQPLENSLHTLIQRQTSSRERSSDLQNIQSIPGAGKGDGSQDEQRTDGSQTDSYWQALSSLPTAEADNAMVYVELQGREYIYMNGGYRGSSPPAYDHNLYRYDIRAAHWEIVSHFPGMINNAAAVDEQGHIFFTAGYSSDTYTVSSLLYIYDPGTAFLKKVAPPAQMPLGFGGSILADRQGHLYISQGFLRAGDGHAQAGTGWYRYDIGTAQWHQLAALPVGLGYVFTANDGNGGILLLGGASDAGQHSSTNKIYRYNIASDSWTQATDSLPQAISGAAGCQVRPGQLALVGGYDPIHDSGTKNAWLLDLHTLKWRSLADLPIGGSVLGAAACDGKGNLFLERGTNNPKVPTSDYWEMTTAPNIKIGN